MGYPYSNLSTQEPRPQRVPSNSSKKESLGVLGPRRSFVTMLRFGVFLLGRGWKDKAVFLAYQRFERLVLFCFPWHSIRKRFWRVLILASPFWVGLVAVGGQQEKMACKSSSQQVNPPMKHKCRPLIRSVSPYFSRVPWGPWSGIPGRGVPQPGANFYRFFFGGGFPY